MLHYSDTKGVAQLAEARKAAGSQDKLLATVQRPLAEMEVSMASERRAWTLSQEAAERSIEELERARDRAMRELRTVQQEHIMERAELEAAQHDKDALRDELTQTRAELDRRTNELNTFEGRRIAVESGVCRVIGVDL